MATTFAYLSAVAHAWAQPKVLFQKSFDYSKSTNCYNTEWNPQYQTAPYEQALGDSEEEELPFNRKWTSNTRRMREGRPSAPTGHQGRPFYDIIYA